MFKTQVEHGAAGEWFHCKVKSVLPWKIVVDLFFYNNIYFFKKNQKQNNRHCVTCYVISMVYTLIDHSFRPISACKDSITDVPPSLRNWDSINYCKIGYRSFTYRKSVIKPPGGAYLFQAHLRRGLIETISLLNLETTMVSVLHKELQCKVEKLK